MVVANPVEPKAVDEQVSDKGTSDFALTITKFRLLFPDYCCPPEDANSENTKKTYTYKEFLSYATGLFLFMDTHFKIKLNREIKPGTNGSFRLREGEDPESNEVFQRKWAVALEKVEKAYGSRENGPLLWKK